MKIKMGLLFLIISTIIVASCQQKEDIELDHKIGQMLLLGFRGMTLDENPNIKMLIKEKYLGGVVLFDYDVPSKKAVRNIESPEQVRALTQSLQALSSDKLLISIDQEGGVIRRLKKKYGFNPGVSHQYLGSLNDLSKTLLFTDTLAKQLYELGINMNLAPVVDVAVNPDNPIIAKLERSFSNDSKIVTDQAANYIQALHNNQVLSTLKHFPGHGSSKDDSHLGLVDVSPSWSEYELDPYRALIKENKVDAIMTAHVYLNQYDSLYPATLSKKIISGLLRTDLRFEGVIVSDDMNMKAISAHYGLKKALELTINAGVDMIAIGNNGDEYDDRIGNKTIELIKELIHEGKVKISQIDQANARIKALKSKEF